MHKGNKLRFELSIKKFFVFYWLRQDCVLVPVFLFMLSINLLGLTSIPLTVKHGISNFIWIRTFEYFSQVFVFSQDLSSCAAWFLFDILDHSIFKDLSPFLSIKCLVLSRKIFIFNFNFLYWNRLVGLGILAAYFLSFFKLTTSFLIEQVWFSINLTFLASELSPQQFSISFQHNFFELYILWIIFTESWFSGRQAIHLQPFLGFTLKLVEISFFHFRICHFCGVLYYFDKICQLGLGFFNFFILNYSKLCINENEAVKYIFIFHF